MDAADAVGHGHHRAFIANFGGDAKILDATLDQFADFGRIELHNLDSLRLKRAGHGGKTATHRRVEYFVADGDAHATDQFFVDAHARLDLALETSLQLRREVRELSLRELERAHHIGFGGTLEFVLQVLKLNLDLRQGVEPAVIDQQAYEVLRLLIERGLHDRGKQLE